MTFHSYDEYTDRVYTVGGKNDKARKKTGKAAEDEQIKSLTKTTKPILLIFSLTRHCIHSADHTIYDIVSIANTGNVARKKLLVFRFGGIPLIWGVGSYFLCICILLYQDRIHLGVEPGNSPKILMHYGSPNGE